MSRKRDQHVLTRRTRSRRSEQHPDAQHNHHHQPQKVAHNPSPPNDSEPRCSSQNQKRAAYPYHTPPAYSRGAPLVDATARRGSSESAEQAESDVLIDRHG